MTNRPRRTGRGSGRDRTIDLSAEPIPSASDGKTVKPDETKPAAPQADSMSEKTGQEAETPASTAMPAPAQQPGTAASAPSEAAASSVEDAFSPPVGSAPKGEETLKDFAAQEGLDPAAAPARTDAGTEELAVTAARPAIGVVGPASVSASRTAKTPDSALFGAGAMRDPEHPAVRDEALKPEGGPTKPTSTPTPARENTAPRRDPVTSAAAVPAAASVRSGGGFGTALGGGLLGALIVLGGAAFLQSQGVLPSLAPAPAAQPSGPSEAEIAALRGEVEQLRAASANPAPTVSPEEFSGLQNTVSGLEGTVTEARDDIAALAPVADTANAARQGADAASQAANAAQATANTAADTANRAAETASAAQAAADKAAADSTAAIGAFDQRLAGIEDASRKASAALAAANLKSAIDRGGPFMGELESFAQTAGGDSEAVAALRTYAPDGVPTLPALQAEWPGAEEAIASALRPPNPEAPLGDQVLAGLRSLVQVRPQGQAAATGPGASAPDAVLGRLDGAIGRGDLAAWKAEWEKLPETAKSASADFARRVDARLNGEKVVSDALSSAIAAPAASGNQG